MRLAISNFLNCNIIRFEVCLSSFYINLNITNAIHTRYHRVFLKLCSVSIYIVLFTSVFWIISYLYITVFPVVNVECKTR